MRPHLIKIVVAAGAAALGPLAAIAVAAGGGSGLAGGAGVPKTIVLTNPTCTVPKATPPAAAQTPTAPAATSTITTPAGSASGGITLITTTPACTKTTPTTITKTKTTPSGTQTLIVPTTTIKTVSTPYNAPTNTSAAPSVLSVPKSNPFARRGMWIWIMGASDHGNVSKLVSDSRKYRVGTLLIKSGDGSSYWSQFSPTLVDSLHSANLKVCAWQFVYGNDPVQEAEVGAKAVKNGADCLVIDAESQYQSKYVQAQTYITTLRKLIGNKFPVALAGFPYVDYHLSFPYSIFLGPNGAQYNVPQMYWQDIGVSPATVFAHTYEYNEIYQRPIYPLGQLYDNPPSAAIAQFHTLSTKYGARGVSWWDWQSSGPTQMQAMVAGSPAPKGFARQRTAATIRPKDKGDLVIWAQQHLAGAGYKITVDGSFGAQTEKDVVAFQQQHHLKLTGLVDGATWDALLRYRAAPVTWKTKKGRPVATLGAPTVTTPGAITTPVITTQPGTTNPATITVTTPVSTPPASGTGKASSATKALATGGSSASGGAAAVAP